MVWRIPTRDIGGTPYEEGLELPPEYLARNEGEINILYPSSLIIRVLIMNTIH